MVDDAAAELGGVGDAHAQASSRSRSAAPARTMPPARRLETASARSLVELMTVIFLASGPRRSRPRAKRSMSMSGAASTTAPMRSMARLAAGAAQHAQGLEGQQRAHAVRDDVDPPAARVCAMAVSRSSRASRDHMALSRSPHS